ncbi:putative short-chain dehydrogenase [Stipitochalara longipes BDJ]|nr:putative short-chain dehydrogenase [Stipitochalara longipes BDJ]
MATGNYLTKLQNSRILIFGATSGIGFGVAEASIQNGATAILSGSNQSKIDKTIEKLRAAHPHIHGDKIQGKVCDLGHADVVESSLTSLLKEATNGGVDKLNHIVFTAGDALPLKPLSEVTPDYISAAGNIRFIAPLILAKLIPTYIVSSPDSSFTMTSGVIGAKPAPGWFLVAAYAMAQEGLTRGLAVDIAPVRVNCVSPGSTKTEMLSHIPDEVQEYMRQKTLTKRLGRVEDIVEAYLYVMKDGYITGEVLQTNGGSLLT